MRIALVAGGVVPIPVPGWGAAEVLIWNYARYLERLGHAVTIYNSIWYQDVIRELNSAEHDFIHLHYDMFTCVFNRHLSRPYCVTSHYGGFARYIPNSNDPSYDILFRDLLDAPGNVVFSERARDTYLESGYRGFLALLRNPVETERFAFAPRGNGRAICLGRIQPRKRQAFLAEALGGRVPIDFAGPHDPLEEPDFHEHGTARYLGSWEKQTVYQRLTEYCCLVLLSRSEGDALVVKEALAAGLSLVVNEASSANLSPAPFITVLPDAELGPAVIAAAVQGAIDLNPSMRVSIREYARARFDYTAVVPEYLALIEQFRAHVR